MRLSGVRMTASALAILMLSVSAAPPVAEAGSFFSVRRTFTTLFLGGSGYLGVMGWKYRRDANRLYSQYKAAPTSDLATSLFRRTSDRDTKSQISIALSGALLVAGLRLAFWGGKEKGEEPARIEGRYRLGVTGRPDGKGVGMELRRSF